MKISTKGRYGLRAMVDLAINSELEHVTLKSIAERQNISEGYLEQVFSALKKSGLVKSVKGAQGGYSIGIKADELTVGDILRVLEGNLSVVEKKDGKDKKDENVEINGLEFCINENVWEKMNCAIGAVVDGITLENLVEEYKKSKNKGILMYYI